MEEQKKLLTKLGHTYCSLNVYGCYMFDTDSEVQIISFLF